MKLQRARLEMSLGRVHAARLCEMTYGSLYKIEAGKRPPGLKVALRISRALGLDPHAIEEFAPAIEKAKALGLVVDLPEIGTHPEPKRLTEPQKAKIEEARRRLLADEAKAE